jgi:phage-related protein
MLTIPMNDHRSFNTPSTWIPLFDVQTSPGNVLYLTPSPTAVTADGHTYEPFPVMIDELRDDGKGEVATVKMTVSNITGTLGTLIKNNASIDGQPITFKVWSVEQGAVVYEETMEIIKVGPITSESITFELGMFNPFLAKLLHEKFMRDFCWNRYKGAGCWLKRSSGTFAAPSGFTAGSPDSCTKKLTDCVRHANVLRFNSFPGIPGNGGYV